MATRTLFDASLSLCIHSSNDPQPLPTAAQTVLSATLTYSPAQSTLFLTLSDLTSRLLLLRHVQTADTFPQARTPKSLSVDFSAYPDLVAKYLNLTLSHSAFVAYLQLDATTSVDGSPAARDEAVLRIIEFEHGYNTTRIQLHLAHASQQELISELADRAREAEGHRQRVADLTRQNEALNREAVDRKRDLDECRTRLVSSEHEASRSADLQRTVEDLRQRLTTAEAARDDTEAARNRAEREARASTTELEKLRKDLQDAYAHREEAVRSGSESDARIQTVVRERDAAAEEIRKGNRIIMSLQEKVRSQQADMKSMQADFMSLRAKSKVKDTLISRLEEKVASLERESRRARDRAAMLEVEKEGLNGRLSSAFSKLEENRAVLESDQQVIAYLNRELNDRMLSDVSGLGSGGRGRGTSSDGEAVRKSVGAGVS